MTRRIAALGPTAEGLLMGRNLEKLPFCRRLNPDLSVKAELDHEVKKLPAMDGLARAIRFPE